MESLLLRDTCRAWWFVSRITQSYRQISTKTFTEIGLGTGNNRLDLGSNLDPDPEIFKIVRYDCKIGIVVF